MRAAWSHPVQRRPTTQNAAERTLKSETLAAPSDCDTMGFTHPASTSDETTDGIKLDLRDRIQAAIYANEQRLVQPGDGTAVTAPPAQASPRLIVQPPTPNRSGRQGTVVNRLQHDQLVSSPNAFGPDHFGRCLETPAPGP